MHIKICSSASSEIKIKEQQMQHDIIYDICMEHKLAKNKKLKKNKANNKELK